jgi:hypothetical protein
MPAAAAAAAAASIASASTTSDLATSTTSSSMLTLHRCTIALLQLLLLLLLAAAFVPSAVGTFRSCSPAATWLSPWHVLLSSKSSNIEMAAGKYCAAAAAADSILLDWLLVSCCG